MPDGTMVLGGVKFGSNLDELDLIFDTGSDWVAVEGSGCTNCEGDTFDAFASLTSRRLKFDISNREYGGSILKGSEWTDRVCITATECIENFEFFVADEQ